MGGAGRGGRPSLPNGAYRGLLAAVARIFVGLVAWFLIAMVVHARPAFSTLGFSWIIQKTWDPSHGKYGLLPFILGTIETTAIAVVLAVPIGLGTALALAYLVPHRLRPALSTAVELLAAVPSVVYGLWGLIVLAPLCREYLEPFLTRVFGWTGLFNGPNQGIGLLLAGIILFVMILPTMVAISRDVLAVVPNEQVEGAMALGATRWQVLRKVVVPGARTGILGAFTLATGRALGETVAVALVIGNSPFIAHSLKSPAATLPSLIVNNFGESTGTELSALFGAGLVLLVIGVVVNALARVLVRSAAPRRWRGRAGAEVRGPAGGRLRGGGLMATITFEPAADPILERRRQIQEVAAASLRGARRPRRSASACAGPSSASPSFPWWRWSPTWSSRVCRPGTPTSSPMSPIRRGSPGAGCGTPSSAPSSSGPSPPPCRCPSG